MIAFALTALSAGIAGPLSCAAVSPTGELARFAAVRDDDSLAIVSASPAWAEHVTGVSALARPEKRNSGAEEYRVQTDRGTFVLGFEKRRDGASPIPIRVEEDIAGVQALNPVRFEGLCVNAPSPVEKPHRPGRAEPVAPIGYAVKPITMGNATFRTECHLVTPKLEAISFEMTTTLGPSTSRFQIPGKSPVPAIDVVGTSLAGLVSRISDPDRKRLTVFISAGGGGPFHVTAEISGENEALVQTIKIEEVRPGGATLLGVGLCDFPSK